MIPREHGEYCKIRKLIRGHGATKRGIARRGQRGEGEDWQREAGKPCQGPLCYAMLCYAMLYYKLILILYYRKCGSMRRDVAKSEKL